jgi:MscS family membrane protein
MYVHLFYLQPESYDPALAAESIHPDLDSIKAIKRAIQIKQILDGLGLYVMLNQLPKEENYIDSLTNQNYYTPFQAELPQVYLEKIGTKWYYSAETIDVVPELHRKIYPLGADILMRILPKKAGFKILGLKLWQWLGIGLTLVFSFLLHFILRNIIRPLIRILSKSRINFEFVPLPQFTKLARYLSFLLIGWFIRIIIPALQLNIETSSFVQKAISIFMIVIVTLIILLLITIGLERAKTLALKTDSRMDDQLIPLLNRIIKIIVVIIAVIAILRLMNVNVTALIAGISIGGLALALAAQDTVKNLIGSVMIFIDQPFQMGDYIMGGDFEGTVEEIGFRTTRIRTVDTSIVAVPNGSIANMSVKNLGVRVFRIFNITLGITYDSTPEQIQDFIGRLKQMILSNEMISHETYYVHFKELADSSLNIMFRCYLKTATYAEELQLKEELLLEILRIARDCGVSFAFPSTSIYMENNQEDSAIQPNLNS